MSQQLEKGEASRTDLLEAQARSDLLQASRLEEEFNVEVWGLVEGGHDVDRVNAHTQIASAATFARWARDHGDFEFFKRRIAAA